MNKPFVSLRPEITRTHALILMHWLEDWRVTQYLTDQSATSRVIAQAIDRTQMPILTPLFNQGGRFFMVHDRNDVPVGFVRLAKTGPDFEIVLVIGDHDNWGRRLGLAAIREGLKLAFLEMRAESVVAKIHPNNTRSLRAFQHCGFVIKCEKPELWSLSLSSGRYLKLLREGKMVNAANIFITEMDRIRLQGLIEAERGPTIVDLEHELERAIVVDPHRVAPDVVTMNSKVRLRMDAEEMDVAIVYPHEADEDSGKLSVLSEIGTAVLGYQEGDFINWIVSDRTRRILVERVIYQPESSGDFHI